MGNISSGCDIVFTIKSKISSDQDITIRMGSTLSYEQVSYYEIAKQLQNNETKRLELRDALKLQSTGISIEYNPEKIVHNNTVQKLAEIYTGFDWEGIDQSTKILTADSYIYFGNDLSGTTIIQRNPKTGINSKIYVIDPGNIEHVSELHQYLLIQSKLYNNSNEVSEIIKNSNIHIILQQLQGIINSLKKDVDEFNKLSEKDSLSNYERKKFTNLSKIKSVYEHFQNKIPKYPKELLLDYLENSSKYFELSYVVGDTSFSIYSELDNIIKELQGKKVKEIKYNDVFANEVVSNSIYIPSRKVSKIKQTDFIKALQIKISDLRVKRESLKEGSKEYDENIAIVNKISKFIELLNKTPKHWADIINFMIDQTDDEFSYSFDSIEKGVIYLKNVPKTLEERYQDFNRKTIELLNPVESDYKGYTMYIDTKGHYYLSRHILTTKSYGKKYKSLEECKKKIDEDIKYQSIGTQSLIEFKTRKDRNVVFVPNQFIPGQVIKSLNLKFNPNQSINEHEEKLIYHIENKINTLSDFYEYISSYVNSDEKYVIKTLQKVVDTFEKAACFIYALNERHGDDRSKITQNDFDDLIKLISDAKYEYFVVEEVGSGFIQHSGGFKKYTTTYFDKNGNKEIRNKMVFKTLITPINPSEISESKIQYDNKVARPLPSIRLLKDLAEKIENKLGIKIHIETQSDLEEKFLEWKEELPSGVKGFVRNGEIYINGSLATETDIFHEYGHIMLGVLKARNFENYYKLIDIVANTDYGKNVKKHKRLSYPNLADSDLNEEVFVDLFAEHMQGRDLDAFLNGTMKDVRKAVDKNFGSIFGKEIITEEFYNATYNNIFRQFSYDLSLIMEEGNGLEISSGKIYRQASNWIESQIKKYKDSKDNKIGIYEECK